MNYSVLRYEIFSISSKSSNSMSAAYACTDNITQNVKCKHKRDM